MHRRRRSIGCADREPDMSRLFSFPFDRSLESQLRSEVRDRIKEIEPTDPGAEFTQLFKKKPKNMRWASHLRLRILHRQFAQGTVWGLPVIVRGARLLWRYRHIKKMLPDNA